MILNKTIRNNENQNDNQATVKLSLFTPSSKLSYESTESTIKMFLKIQH